MNTAPDTGTAQPPGGSSSGPVRLLIVDDHPVVRAGMRALFADRDDLTLVGEAADGPEALTCIAALRPDVVLMDLRLPTGDGIDLVGVVNRDFPQTAVVVVTTFVTYQDVIGAIQAGARGYVLKDADETQLVQAIHSAREGGMVLAPEAAALLARQVRTGDDPSAGSLSDREITVLSLAGQGLTNAQIGERLCLSQATVKTHLRRAYAKLGVRDRASAVRALMRLNLLRDDPPAPGP